MELVRNNNALVRGKPYMAFVMVTPYYEANNSQPIMLRFNELVHKKKAEDKPKEIPLTAIMEEEQLL